MSSKLNIFITGITGSVGHYLFDVLKDDPRYHLYLLVRDKKRLKRDIQPYQNVTFIEEDIQDVSRHKELLQEMDYVVLIATNWGGYREPWRQNVYPIFRILRACNSQRLKKVIYFSTASILDRDHQPVEKIRTIGTNYIRSKFLTYQMLKKNKYKNSDKVITVFPTWVMGGDADHPYSHAMQSLLGLKKRINLFKHFSLDFSFHFIHCYDLALIVKHMLENDMAKKEHVLGNEKLTVGEYLREVATALGQTTGRQIKIPNWLVKFFAWTKRNHPWDQYCLTYRHFVYNTVNCQQLGLKTDYDTVAGILKTSRVK